MSMTTTEYIGEHREQDPQAVINAALRLALAEAVETRGTEVYADIEAAPSEVRAVIYAALEGE
jgi:hypothetical protein